MYPIIVDDSEKRFYFDCTREYHPYFFYPFFKSLIAISCRKQCFLPSVQMRMITLHKKKYLKLKLCRTHREFSGGSEVYFLVLLFEIITLDVVHEKSTIFYMIPLQLINSSGNVVTDLNCFPEILVCDISDMELDRSIACDFLCSVFTNKNKSDFNDLEIDYNLLSRVSYCAEIYNRLIEKQEDIKKIDCEHLIRTDSITCGVRENFCAYFTSKLIKFV